MSDAVALGTCLAYSGAVDGSDFTWDTGICKIGGNGGQEGDGESEGVEEHDGSVKIIDR